MTPPASYYPCSSCEDSQVILICHDRPFLSFGTALLNQMTHRLCPTQGQLSQVATVLQTHSAPPWSRTEGNQGEARGTEYNEDIRLCGTHSPGQMGVHSPA
jgi:hypothetical protein